MNKDLLIGHPTFVHPDAAQVALHDGQAAGWHAALRQGAHAAAAGTRGPFAVALRLPDGRVFMAVDRFAVHTLCFRVDGGALHFGADAAAVAALGAGLDNQALFDYLYGHAIPSPRTVFTGVQRLPAGHFAVFDAGQLHIQPYWTPGFEITDATFADRKSSLRSLLGQAVAAQLDGSKAACFLSGGIDSSTIAGLIGQVTGKPPATYSIGFQAEGYDEMAYARLASKHFGTEHHEYYISPADLVRLIPKVAAHFDQPFGNSSALPTHYCALQARQDGVTRLLAGDGGDELFGGNTRYAKQRVFAYYDRVPRALRRSLLEPMSHSGALDRLPLLRKGASYVRQAAVAMPDRLETYNLLHWLGPHKVLTPGFLAQVDMMGPQAAQRAVWQSTQRAGFIDRMLAYDWRYTLAESDLRKVAGATELAGVSAGFPFLDPAVVDFSTSLPADYKVRGLKLRWFFKEAMRGFLPQAIIDKKKHGFGLPFGVWALRDAPLNALARDSVRAVGGRGIVRREFTDTLVDKLLPQHPGFYGEMVWILMMLEQWLRHHKPDYRLAD